MSRLAEKRHPRTAARRTTGPALVLAGAVLLTAPSSSGPRKGRGRRRREGKRDRKARPRMDVESHDRTNFPLTGKHRTLSCRECHLNLVFEGTPTDCEVCHWQRRQDDRYGLRLGMRCSDCHTPQSWKKVDPAKWSHEMETGFRLEGIHRTLDCETCHGGGFAPRPTACFPATSPITRRPGSRIIPRQISRPTARLATANGPGRTPHSPTRPSPVRDSTRQPPARTATRTASTPGPLQTARPAISTTTTARPTPITKPPDSRSIARNVTGPRRTAGRERHSSMISPSNRGDIPATRAPIATRRATSRPSAVSSATNSRGRPASIGKSRDSSTVPRLATPATRRAAHRRRQSTLACDIFLHEGMSSFLQGGFHE